MFLTVLHILLVITSFEAQILYQCILQSELVAVQLRTMLT